MILVSVGTSEFPFDRLLTYLDSLCEQGVVNGGDIIAQVGCARYKPRHFRSFQLLSREEYQEYVDRSSVIITHAGTGSVVPAIKQGKKVIVVPRQSDLGEHVDDHQFELADIFFDEGYVLRASSEDELREALEAISQFHARPFKSNSHQMNRLIIDFIKKGDI